MPFLAARPNELVERLSPGIEHILGLLGACDREPGPIEQAAIVLSGLDQPRPKAA